MVTDSLSRYVELLPRDTIDMKTPLHQLSAKDAREFFLRQDAYCNFDLPSYFTFEQLLYDSISEHDRKGGQFIEEWKARPKQDEAVNYRLLMSKDGLYDWREFQLAHPSNLYCISVGYNSGK